MSDLRTAASAALEALEKSRVFVTTREKIKHPEGTEWYDGTITALRAALAQKEQEPVALTIERLRDALVASRIIPPESVEDPDGYDGGVTLCRIEALHKRIT
jgi:hypothetical protein